MLTQAMPALAQALRGQLPPLTVRRMMQALGNCNMPLEHRGPVSVAAGPRPPGAGPGAYGGGAWPPGALGDILNVNNHNLSSIFNNNSFIDASSVSNNFDGDSFLIQNSSEFLTQYFPTQIVQGVIGRDGLAGAAGLTGIPGSNGLNGLNGIAGINGLDGAPGVAGVAGVRGQNGLDGQPGVAGPAGRNGLSGRDGRAGVAGVAGAPGAAGPPGAPGRDGIDGLPGPPGRPGRDANIGNLRIEPAGRRYPGDTEFVTSVDVRVQDGATISIPKYKFDADTCGLVSDGTEEVPVNISLEVETETDDVGIVLPTFRIVGN